MLERFRADGADAARVMAAYIDLNPVQAGMVAKPEGYRWDSDGEAMRCRVRYFTDGMTVGSWEFVDLTFKQSLERFEKKRKTGARPMRDVGWEKGATQIYSMRQLMVRAIE